MLGRFKDSSIIIDIDVYGVSDELKKSFPAIVDTGFSGYLTLPFVEAFPLGLVLKGEQSNMLADGTVARHFVCLGTVVFKEKEVVVPMDVQHGGPILIGMQLLKKLELDLCIQFQSERFEFKVPGQDGEEPHKPHRGLTDVKINL